MLRAILSYLIIAFYSANYEMVHLTSQTVPKALSCFRLKKKVRGGEVNPEESCLLVSYKAANLSLDIRPPL